MWSRSPVVQSSDYRYTLEKHCIRPENTASYQNFIRPIIKLLLQKPESILIIKLIYKWIRHQGWGQLLYHTINYHYNYLGSSTITITLPLPSQLEKLISITITMAQLSITFQLKLEVCPVHFCPNMDTKKCLYWDKKCVLGTLPILQCTVPGSCCI